MQIEAAELRLADAVRLAGEGEREIRKIEKNGSVRVWFRGDEERDEPSGEFEPGEVLEIQRPGDLFDAPAPPKTVEEARDRIIEHMTALGWSVSRAGFGRINDYVTDPSDTVRLKLKPRAVALQVRRFVHRSWRWNPNTRSLGSMIEFATNIEENSARLLRIARTQAKERHDADQTRVAAAPSTEANPTGPASSEPVIIRYAYREGVLLGGNTREHKDVIKSLLTPYQFRYSRNLPGDAAWYVQRTRGTVQPRERIELLAEALRRAGVPVVVEYTDPETLGMAEHDSKHTRRPNQPSAKLGQPPDNAKRAAKLRALADKLEARANAELSADRLENTARRANMAAGIRERARGQIVIAQTMRRAADAVAAGELEYIARLSSRAQIEDLDQLLRTAKWERDRMLNRSDRDREPEIEDLEYVEYKPVRGSPYALQGVLDDSAGLSGVADARRRLERYVDRNKNVVELDADGIAALREIIAAVKRDKGRSFSHAAERIIERLESVDRLARLGIVDAKTLRAALREYIGCCRGKVQKGSEDPSAVRKRELRFAKIPGFFPTPRELAERVVGTAEIRPGMRVLEPSAGSGAIAEVIRERHPTARLELVERQHSLREVLKGDGFTLAGDDFLAFKPAAPYDRIVMNPPFEQRQDTEHIGRALDLLAPGGRLVAIASSSLASRDDAATRKLRDRIAELGGRIEPLPAGSFKESGTNVNTVLVVVDRPATVKAKDAAAPTTSKKAMSIEPNDQRLDVASLKDAWSDYQKRIEKRGLGWKVIPGTSCFKHEDDDSLTLCTAYQTKAIGSCPPSMAGLSASSKQLMLCQPDHEPEFFRGQEPGIVAAKAEAANRVVRSRSRTPAAEPRVDALPDALDFEGQAAWLASVVPSGIVYEKDNPLRPIPLAVAAPLIVTPNGESLSVPGWPVRREVPAGSVLVPAMSPGQMRLDSFVRRLGTELLPYRGPIGVKTLQILASLASGAAPQRRKVKMTLADFRSATIDGKTVYWIPAPDGSIAAGPVTATGKSVSNRKVIAALSQLATTGLPLTELPEGSTLDDTIIVAVLRQGAPMWWAWNTRTHEFRSKSGEDGQWSKPNVMPATSTWQEEGGYSDFPHVTTHTLELFLEAAPPGAGFRVAGPWLGYLFPSDFNGKVVFDEPTGGELDLAAIERELMESAEHLPEGTDPVAYGRWSKLAAKRLRWARKRLAAAEKAKRPSGRQAKRATRTPAPTRKPEPVAASSSKRDEENDMSAKKSKTKSTGKKKTAAAKKAAAKKAAAKRAAAKKAAAKKAAAKKTAAKKASTKKRAAKKTTTKKPTTNGSATQKRSSTSAATQPSMPPTPVADGKAPTPADETDRPRRRLRFNRNDTVRFRKRSQIAAGLGVGLDKEFKVEMVTTQEGRPMVVLRVGQGKHSALIKVPPGHLAIVSRGDEIPASIRSCAARLAEFKGPITPKTRRVLAELARRA